MDALEKGPSRGATGGIYQDVDSAVSTWPGLATSIHIGADVMAPSADGERRYGAISCVKADESFDLHTN